MSIPKFCACTITLLLLGMAAALAETWRWTDADGQVHFGDRPPVGVSAERLDVQSKPSPLTDEERAQRAAQLQADREAREAEAARAARRAAREDAASAEQQASNRARCDRARWALAALESGRPVYRDANGAYRVKRPPAQPDTYTGPREYLEDADRQLEIARNRADLQRYCAAFPELKDLSLADEELRHAEACEFAAVELEQLMQDEARASPEEIARRQRFLDEECR